MKTSIDGERFTEQVRQASGSSALRKARPSRRQLLHGLTGLLFGSFGAAMALGSGCGAPLQLVAQRGEVFTPGAARVLLHEVSGNLIHVQVLNQTGYPLAIYRDNFLLSTSTGMRSRLAGGASNVYMINPGGRHDVKLRYSLAGLHRGEPVALLLQTALVVNGQSLPIESLPFTLR